MTILQKTKKIESCFNDYDNAFQSQADARMRMIASRPSVSPDALVVHLLASMRADPTGVNDPHNSDIMQRILYADEIQFRRMFRVSCYVFDSLLEDLSLHLSDGGSYNTEQNIPASLKLGVALYYMAHGGDAIHLEAASEATALKYLHRVAELICTHLACKWMGESILKENGYMEANRERFRRRNGFPYVGAAIDGTHIAYQPRKGEYEQDYKNYKTWTSLLCIGIVNAFHLFIDIDVGWPGRLHDKTCTDHSNVWHEMHMNRKLWLGEDGVALADTAWVEAQNLS